MVYNIFKDIYPIEYIIYIEDNSLKFLKVSFQIGTIALNGAANLQERSLLFITILKFILKCKNKEIFFFIALPFIKKARLKVRDKENQGK